MNLHREAAFGHQYRVAHTYADKGNPHLKDDEFSSWLAINGRTIRDGARQTANHAQVVSRKRHVTRSTSLKLCGGCIRTLFDHGLIYWVLLSPIIQSATDSTVRLSNQVPSSWEVGGPGVGLIPYPPTVS